MAVPMVLNLYCPLISIVFCKMDVIVAKLESANLWTSSVIKIQSELKLVDKLIVLHVVGGNYVEVQNVQL